MLNALFNRVKSFIYKKTHYNPTELPDWAINNLCEISKTKDSISLELNMHGYRSYLTDIGFELPPFRQMLHAANEGELKEFLTESTVLDREISMFSDNIDSDATCKYPDMGSFYKEEAERREKELNDFTNSPEAQQNRLNAYNDKGEFCAFQNLKTAYEENPDQFEPEVEELVNSL
ncbi:MAG: hypothetical protein GY941_12320 [Planctomycetes bacterium]|nr:hypothetical protein [Planctomycetota bacterium]